MFFKKTINRQQMLGLCIALSILFMDTMLYSLIIPLIPYLTKTLNASSTMIGFLVSSYAIGLLIATPLFGPLSDRIGRKKPILFGLSVLIISTLLFSFAHTMPSLIIARFIQGVAAAANVTASLALIADLFPQKLRGTMMGIAVTGISIGLLLGAPIGGALFDAGGYMMPFLVIAGIAFSVLVIVLITLVEPSHYKEKTTSAIKFLRHPMVLFIILVVLLSEAAVSLLEPVLPVFLTDQLHLSPSTVGLLFGAMSLSYGLVSPLSGALSDRFHPFMIMIIGLLWSALTIPLMIVAKSLWQETIAMILVGAGIGFALSPTLGSLGKIVDRDGSSSYGAAYSLFNIFDSIGMMLGPLIGGILADLLPIKTSMLVVSVSLLIFAALLTGMLKIRERGV
ncbi:multidrug resistance protein [Scopulibacillus daqui]|uniref:Multidrug resistance protein n=1 Tax=Scopulibacillus daqui TaxID=1469162 RepID=A0ABS2PXB2_9BACL|nr:multidrug resistance protein [Scopulibacillus daqui]